MANDYEGLTQGIVGLNNDEKAMMADVREKAAQRRDQTARELSGFKQEGRERAAKLAKELSGFKQGLESETSKMLDRFGEEDKERAAHVAGLLDETRKLVQGFCDESSSLARSFAKLLACAKSARNSAPLPTEKPEPAQPAKKAAAPAPRQDHAKARSARKKGKR